MWNVMAMKILFDCCGWLLMLVVLLLPAGQCHALTLLLNNGERLRGYPVGDVKEGAVLVISVPQPGGGLIKRSVAPAEIRRIIETVDPQRLAGLDGSNAKAYYNYAEELAQRKVDPQARDTAIRLFLISAHLDTKQQGRAAFLGLIPLARNAEEAKRFRAMAYLLDPSHAESTLGDVSADVAAPAANSKATRDLLNAMQLLRQANRAEAASLLRRDDVAKSFAAFERVFPKALLDKFLARTGDRLLPYELEAILRVELALEGFDAGPGASRATGAGWGQIVSAGGDTPVKLLKMSSLARRLDPAAKPGQYIDPSRTIYRNGNWTAP